MQLETLFHLQVGNLWIAKGCVVYLIGKGNRFLIVVLKQEMTTREYMENQDAEEPDDFIISLTAQVS